MVSELSEQMAVVRALRKSKILFCAVPNGGWRDKRGARMLKASGVVRGVPDLLIFDPPPLREAVGVALELKREKGGSVSPEQQRWLQELNARGWVAIVARGAADALRQLRELGFEVRT